MLRQLIAVQLPKLALNYHTLFGEILKEMARVKYYKPKIPRGSHQGYQINPLTNGRRIRLKGKKMLKSTVLPIHQQQYLSR